MTFRVPDNLLNQRAGRHVVVALAGSRRGGAVWWVRCDRCGAQTQHRATNIRKAQKRDDYVLRCGECGL